MLFLSACQSTLNHIEPMDHRLAPRRVIGDHKNCRDFWVVNKSAKVMTSSSVKNFTIHHAYPRNSTDRLLSVSDDPPGPRLTKSLKKTWHRAHWESRWFRWFCEMFPFDAGFPRISSNDSPKDDTNSEDISSIRSLASNSQGNNHL